MTISKRIQRAYNRVEDWAYDHPRLAEFIEDRREMLADPEIHKAWGRGNLRMAGASILFLLAVYVPVFYAGMFFA